MISRIAMEHYEDPHVPVWRWTNTRRLYRSLLDGSLERKPGWRFTARHTLEFGKPWPQTCSIYLDVPKMLRIFEENLKSNEKYRESNLEHCETYSSYNPTITLSWETKQMSSGRVTRAKITKLRNLVESMTVHRSPHIQKRLFSLENNEDAVPASCRVLGRAPSHTFQCKILGESVRESLIFNPSTYGNCEIS